MKRVLLLIIFTLKVFTSISQTAVKSMMRIPDTGQKNSYTSTFGEDNDYTINWPFFIKHNDGTCTDTVTGLMWQIMDGGEMSIENARLYCDTLQLANYNDWRLPNPHEAFSILNHQNNNPALENTTFTKTAAEYWWTSVNQSNDITKIWCTNAGGGIGNHPKTETISAGGTKKFHVRAVRDITEPTTIPNRYVDNGDGTFTDLITNLKWQKTPNTVAMSWENALIYAETLNLAGDSNWRLPNIKELHSLNDESTINPSINSKISAGAGVKKYWSSTSLPNQTTKAWYWETQFGITTYDVKTNNNYVWCVSSNVGGKTAINTPEQKKPTVYPNPFNQRIQISNGNSSSMYYLYTIDGQLIYSGNAIELQDFSRLESGLYLLKMSDNSSIIKMIKSE